MISRQILFPAESWQVKTAVNDNPATFPFSRLQVIADDYQANLPTGIKTGDIGPVIDTQDDPNDVEIVRRLNCAVLFGDKANMEKWLNETKVFQIKDIFDGKVRLGKVINPVTDFSVYSLERYAFTVDIAGPGGPELGDPLTSPNGIPPTNVNIAITGTINLQ